MTEKYQRAITRLQPLLGAQAITPVGKGERLRATSINFLKQLDQSMTRTSDQSLSGLELGDVIEIKTVMELLVAMRLTWGLLPLDQLIEWAATQGFANFSDLKKQFEIYPVGGGECTIEIACDPKRDDIINVFKTSGILGLREYLIKTGESVATDKPGIVRYFFRPDFFPSELLTVLGGSLEPLPKSWFPVIIGAVQTGNSLQIKGWLRLADTFSAARLLSSQLVVVIKKEQS